MSPNSPEVKEVLAQATALLDQAIRQACLHLHHQPTPAEVKRLKQRLVVILLEDDCRRLRTFDPQKGRLESWVRTVAQRYVKQFLGEEKRWLGLEAVPPKLLIQAPEQEERLLEQERQELLEETLRQLQLLEQKLFELWRQGLTVLQIAKRVKMTSCAVYQRKRGLLKKLQGRLAKGR